MQRKAYQHYHLLARLRLAHPTWELPLYGILPFTGGNTWQHNYSINYMCAKILCEGLCAAGRAMATDQSVRSELCMHGLLPYRHVSLQVEIDRAHGALQACDSALQQYQVTLCAVVPNALNLAPVYTR